MEIKEEENAYRNCLWKNKFSAALEDKINVERIETGV